VYYYGSDFIILLPAILIAAWAQFKVSSTFEKYSKIGSVNGYSGSQVARMLLDANGLFDIPVEIIGGRLTDHYDPAKRIMRLSQDVFYGTSVAAIGVAAHETGHAVQHMERYSPLIIRNSIAPVVSFSSNASWIIILLGFFLRQGGLVQIGILLFTAVVLFQIITLPVEFNASSRALSMLGKRGILYENEIKGARSVLSAAAMTYIAAALTAIAQLLRLIMISNSRNRD
jgi:uncharacterized protein